MVQIPLRGGEAAGIARGMRRRLLLVAGSELKLMTPDSANEARPRILILGGGPTGLYAARVLTQRGHAVTLIEKEERPGGLATSHARSGNWYDLGVHMLHEFDRGIFEDIRDHVMGEERIEVALDAKIRWAGAFYRYPLQFGDMVRGIPPLTLARCVAGLLATQLWYKILPRAPKDAEEALIQLYGRPLYEFFFRDFTHRYWGFPTTELDAKFITTKMPRLTAVDVIKKVLGKAGIKDRSVKAVESALSEETLHYSKTGAEAMTRRLAETVRAGGGRVLLSREVSGVEIEGGRVRAVTVRDEERGVEERHECDYVINTVPLPLLVASVRGDAVPAEVVESCGHLKYKPITVHGLLVNKPKCIDGLYIYYRERFFHRVGEPKNAGLRVTPEDHSVLIVETTCEEGDEKWEATPEVRERIMADLEAENIVRRDQIVEWNVFHARHGYPVFRLGFEPHFRRIMDWVGGIANLRTAGRQGAFCYPNMHSAMRQGAKAAEAIEKQMAADKVAES